MNENKPAETPEPTSGVLTLKLGGEMTIEGIKVKVAHVNPGKRRFTLVPVRPGIKIAVLDENPPRRLSGPVSKAIQRDMKAKGTG